MLVETTYKQGSFYTELYHIIPENHILKRIDSAISLSFVNELLADRYCKNFGRLAKEPETMMRIQFLKYLYTLSDVQLLQDFHIEANTIKKVPERIMKQLAKNIFKAKGQEEYAIPDYTQIEDHAEAKQVMKDYLEDLIEQVKEETPAEETSEAIIQATEEAQEILASDLFIEQKGIRSLVDKDARVGRKSKTHSFYGYKAEICQTTDGSLITSVTVEPGSYVDGSNFKDHLEEALKAGLTVTGVYGDKAYFRPDILNLIKAKGIF